MPGRVNEYFEPPNITIHSYAIYSDTPSVSTTKPQTPVRAGTPTGQSKAATPVKSTSAVKPAVVKEIVLY